MRKFLSRVHSAYDAPSPADARETRSIFKPRMRRPNFLASVVVNTIRALALIVLILMLAGAGAVVGIARAYVDTAPSLDLTLIDDQAQTSFIYDAQGNLITDYKGTEDRVMVSISQMPMRLRNAFVAVEDARFYTHNGIDVKRIIGAFVKNFVSGSQQGGSTITQQLIKNTILSSEQSYKRKIQEAYLAMQLETQYSKEQILESYLNTIYLGENYYGVYTAARGYFGKELYRAVPARVRHAGRAVHQSLLLQSPPQLLHPHLRNHRLRGHHQYPHGLRPADDVRKPVYHL